jgi:NAD(P)H-flavin reductase
MLKGLYLPHLATITGIRQETPDTATFALRLDEPGVARRFSYTPGQFVQVSVFGVGECPISIASNPLKGGGLELCIRAVGRVTRAIHSLEVGQKIGIRGPFGNGFPIERIKRRDVLIIAGGIGIAPLRGLIGLILQRRKEFGKLEILYGARDPGQLCFRGEYRGWRGTRTQLYLTVDKAHEGWKGKVGLVPEILREIGPSPQGKVAITCGPPVMIRLVLDELFRMGYKGEQVLMTLELKMKCGVGKCGRCNIGPRFVCMDGPVFWASELERLHGYGC